MLSYGWEKLSWEICLESRADKNEQWRPERGKRDDVEKHVAIAFGITFPGEKEIASFK